MRNKGANDLVGSGTLRFTVSIRNHNVIAEKGLPLYGNADVREQMAQSALPAVHALEGCNENGRRATQVYAQGLGSRANRMAYQNRAERGGLKRLAEAGLDG